MLSKILTGGFILIMVGAIVAGAIAVFSPAKEVHAGAQSTAHQEQLGQTVQAESLHEGQGQGPGGQNDGQGLGLGQSEDQGQGLEHGRGQGQGQGQGRGRQADTEHEAIPLELETVEGVVVETDELRVQTADGKIVQVGLGPSSYRDSQGFVLKVGEHVSVSGYWEDDEFKATVLENQTTGESIVLRDPTGRPMWAGQGRGQNRGS